MNNSEEPKLSAQLEAAGVPAHVAVYLEEQRPIAFAYWGGQGLTLLILVAGFAVGAYWLWPLFERMTEANAVAVGQRVGALMVQYNFGMSLVLALFGWIFAAGAIGGFAGIATERLRASTFAFTALNAKQAIARWGLQRTLRALSGETDPKAYVRRAVVNWQWWMAASAAVLLLISACAVSRDVQANGLYTRSHYITHRSFHGVRASRCRGRKRSA